MHVSELIAPVLLLYFPAGQDLHDVCPSWSWYMPCAHTLPSLYLPFAVAVHLSLASNPDVVPTLPPGQSLHPLSDEMPVALLYLPRVQLSQLFASEVYGSLLVFPYLPLGQDLHDV